MKITESYEGVERMLPSGALTELARLNRDYLDLLIADPCSGTVSLHPAVLDGLRLASSIALDAMSACSYPLFIIEAHPAVPAGIPFGNCVHDPATRRYGIGAFEGPWPSFTMAALSFAWQLCRQNPLSARVMLGFPGAAAEFLAALDPWNLRSIAARQVLPLQPRWGDNPCFWPGLLKAAGSRDVLGLDLARLLGVQLLAADLHPPRAASERQQASQRAP